MPPSDESAHPSDDPTSSEAVISYGALLVAVVLVATFIGSYVVIRRQFHLLPESSVGIFVGFIIGGVLRVAGVKEGAWSFDPEVFFYVMLPPIIFDAGYALKRRLFIVNIVPILTFAIVGTLIATASLGTIIIAASRAGWMQPGTLGLYPDGGSIQPALLYASLLSATDPVATLAVLSSKEVNADQTLQSVLFGESVLNDAVAIVLFQTLRKLVVDKSSSSSSSSASIGDEVGEAAGRFVEVLVCSTGIGLAIAFALSFLLRHAYFYEQAVHLEVALVMCAAYAAYALAEVLELSGVLALFFCGIILGHYNWYNLSNAAKLVTGHLTKCLAYLAETLTFVYLGYALKICPILQEKVFKGAFEGAAIMA